MSTAKFFRFWAPVLAYQALLFALSSRPQVPIGPNVWDKALHFVAYGILAILWLRVLQGGATLLPVSKAFLAVLLTVLFGASDEFHQSFVPGRTASALDLLADTLGAAFAVGLVFLWSTRKNATRREGPAVDGI